MYWCIGFGDLSHEGVNSKHCEMSYMGCIDPKTIIPKNYRAKYHSIAYLTSLFAKPVNPSVLAQSVKVTSPSDRSQHCITDKSSKSHPSSPPSPPPAAP